MVEAIRRLIEYCQQREAALQTAYKIEVVPGTEPGVNWLLVHIIGEDGYYYGRGKLEPEDLLLIDHMARSLTKATIECHESGMRITAGDAAQ